MKSVIVAIVGLAFLLGTTASAQDQPTKGQLAIDYSLVDFNPKVPGTTSQVMNGGGGSIVYFPIDWLGIKMELQGYGNTTQTAVIPAGNPVVPRGARSPQRVTSSPICLGRNSRSGEGLSPMPTCW